MKACVDCKHYNLMKYCYAPQNVIGISPVDGKTKIYDLLFCRDQRALGWLGSRLNNNCGQEGRWFEPRVFDKVRVES